MLKTTQACKSVLAERARQDSLWGIQNHDPFTFLTLLGEEYGEACQAAAQALYDGKSIDRIREEVVQVAALALAIVECLDRGQWQWPSKKIQSLEAENKMLQEKLAALEDLPLDS